MLTGEAKRKYQREYMRDYMRRRRVKTEGNVKTQSDDVKTFVKTQSVRPILNPVELLEPDVRQRLRKRIEFAVQHTHPMMVGYEPPR